MNYYNNMMNSAHLDELISVEQTYWWHVAKNKLLIELLKRECPLGAQVLEGGIGSSNNLLALKQLGYEVTGLDLLPAAVEHCRLLGIYNVQVHDLQQPWPVEHRAYDAVLLLDVIEHCLDPVAVLSHARRALRPNGKILVTVPAIPFLMGPWDRALGHQRRYTMDILQKNAHAAALKLIWGSYWNSFSLLPAFVIRTIEQFFMVSSNAEFPRLPNYINQTLIQLANIERKIICKIPIPIGLSLIGVMVR